MQMTDKAGVDQKHNVVLVVGSANMDLVVRCERFPTPGETILGGEFGTFPGGKGANQAVAAAKLGGEVYFIGKMGHDIFRENLVASMEQDGVRLEHLLIDAEAPTGVALITVASSGQNEIIVASGSNMHLTAAEVEANEDAFKNAGVLLLQLEVPLETVRAAARLGRTSGAKVILNPAPAQSLSHDLLALVDLVTPNESEAEALTGLHVSDEETAAEAGRALLGLGAGAAVVTLGAAGAVHVTREGARRYPAPSVTAVDTTAAGDAFNGALALALSRGAGVSESVEYANRVAALSVTRMGAQPSLPTADELSAWEGVAGPAAVSG